MDTLLKASNEEQKLAKERLDSLERSKTEVEELAKYTLDKLAALSKEVDNDDNLPDPNFLIQSIETLKQDRDFLQSQLNQAKI